MQLQKDRMKALLAYSNYVNKNGVVVHFNKSLPLLIQLRQCLHRKYMMTWLIQNSHEIVIEDLLIENM